MSAAPAQQSPVRTFLGDAAGAGGPFALLGLHPERCDDAAILEALDRQLARINAHPQAQTPAGDEVRLALHAAAAQLLDPSVRSSMRARWRAGVEPVPGLGSGMAPPIATPSGPQDRCGEGSPAARPTWSMYEAAPPAFDPDLLAQATGIIASCGGLSAESIRRVGILAGSRGIPPGRVPALIVALSRQPAPTSRSAGGSGGAGVVAGGGGGGRAAEARHAESYVTTSATGGAMAASASPFAVRAEEPDTSARTLRIVAVCSIAGLLLMAGTFWAVIVLTTPAVPPGAPARQPSSLTGHTPEPERPESLFPRAAAGAAAPAALAPSVPPDDRALMEDLRACIEALSTDPAAASAQFDRVNARIGAVWSELPVARRRAIVDQVVEYVYRVGATESGPGGAIERIAELGMAVRSGVIAPEDVGRVSWSAGLLVRLQRERDISARAGSLIEARLGSLLDGARPMGALAFEAGAAAVLATMPGRLAAAGESPSHRIGFEPRLEAWRRWLACVRAITAGNQAAETGMVMGALEVLLRDASQPTDDRLVFEAIGLLVESLDWSASGGARAWLVRSMDAPGITVADAHAITHAVATRAPAGGLDVSMILPARATELERRDLRERLTLLWNLDDPTDRDSMASDWREARAAALERRASDLTPEEHLATAVVLSRVSHAALLRWRGMAEEAGDRIDDLDADVGSILSAQGRMVVGSVSDVPGDGVWAEQYLLAARSIPIRIDLLRQADQGMTSWIGPIDAEVLMSEAIRGNPVQVAAAAHDLVVRLSASPAILNALLEELPRMPKTRRHAALVGSLTGAWLPPVSDPRWALLARRAVVARLLEMLAAGGEMRVYNELASLLAESIFDRSDGGSLSPQARTAMADDPAMCAARLRGQWRRQAEPLLPSPALGLTLDEIDRRRASRLDLAQGPVQTFAAEQLAAVELMALVVAAEQPERVDAVRGVLADLARERQRARHITEQISAAEAAAVSLWGVRLREGVP